MNSYGTRLLDRTSPDPALRSVISRLQWMLALGVIELIAVSLWVDTAQVQATGIWRLALKKLPDLVLFGGVGVGLGALIGGIVSWGKLREAVARNRVATRFPWALYGIHLVCLGGFVALSLLMSSRGQTAEMLADKTEVAALWFALGLSAGAIWLVGLLPAVLWRPVIATGFWAFAAAAPLTIVTWAIARGTRESWWIFSEPTLNSVLWVLRLCGEEPVHDPASVSASLHGFSINIQATCSGYQGFGVMAAFSTLYVWAFRGRLRFPQAWLLVPLAVSASLIGNVLRIAALMEIGARVSPTIALGGFHSQAGWLFLIGIAVLVVGTAQRLAWFNRRASASLNLRDSPSAACLVPFLIWNVVGIVSQVMTSQPGQDPFYPLRWVAVLIPMWYWRAWYSRLLTVDASTLIGVLSGGGAFAVWMLLESLRPDLASDSPASSMIESGTAAGMAWIAARVAGHVVFAPLVEELAFRGYLMRRLQTFRFEQTPFESTAWPGILVSSLAFGLLHGDRWIAGALVGFLYALTVRVTGRLSAGVAAHATTNALLTLYVLATSDFERWH